MKKTVVSVLLVALLSCLAVSAMAVTWTKIGSSGFSTTPSTLQDWWRPVLNSIAVDGSGNVYMTANNANNNGVAGGITIFKTNGSKVDVNLNALGYRGGVTKMVKAGDGKIYALQNWREGWANVYTGGGDIPNSRNYAGEGISDKILRINADGTADLIVDANKGVQDGWIGQFQTGGGGAPVIVDVPGEAGNKAIQFNHVAGKYEQYARPIRDAAATLAAKFRVSAYTPGTARTDCLLLMAGQVYSTPMVTVGIDQTDSRFKLFRISGTATVLQDLGPLNTGAFNEVYLYVNGTTGEVKCKWNGTTYSFTITNPAELSGNSMQNTHGTGWAQFGGGLDWGPAGTSTAMFDWVGYGRGEIMSNTSPSQWVAYNTGDADLAADGTTVIWNGLPKDYNNKLSGMAVGSDGNVYFTYGAAQPYYKYHFFWRYNVGVTPHVIEPSLHDGTSDGAGEIHLFTDIEPVGNDQFAVVLQNGQNWRLDPMSWATARATGGATAGTTSAWGRAFPTKLAYDAKRNKFWAGGWGPAGGGSDYVFTEWGRGTRTNSIVDLGGGNKGVQQGKTTDNDTRGWQLVYKDAGIPSPYIVRAFTGAARFRMDALTNCDQTWLITLRPDCQLYGADQYYAPFVVIGINYVSGTPHYTAWLRRQDNSLMLLADLGTVDLGTFHTVYAFTECTFGGSSSYATERRVKVWWDGAQVYDAPVADADCRTGGTNSFAQFGTDVHFAWLSTSQPGTLQMTWDWFRVGRGVITPSDPVSKFDYDLDGSDLPQYQTQLKSTTMGLYSGDPAVSGLFSATGYVANATVWHANGNNPQRMDGNKRAPGAYWFSALDVNPVDGKAWMAWNAEPQYNFGDIGRIITYDVAQAKGDEGLVEAGSAITDIKFIGGKAYASVCNLTTGVYSLYAADLPATPDTVGKAKGIGAGAWIDTTAGTGDVVTYSGSGFFYVQSGQTSGIKVVPFNAGDVKSKGDKVTLTGYVDTVDGEAVVRAKTVNLISSGNDDPKPLGLTVKSVGGGITGAQPATVPGAGLNSTGLFVRVAGKYAKYVNNDILVMLGAGSPWFTIDDGSGAQTTYFNGSENVTVPGIKVLADVNLPVGTPIAVNGVAGLDPRVANPPLYFPGQRMIFTRSASDIQRLDQ